jgi:hypothetical protein
MTVRQGAARWDSQPWRPELFLIALSAQLVRVDLDDEPRAISIGFRR